MTDGVKKHAENASLTYECACTWGGLTHCQNGLQLFRNWRAKPLIMSPSKLSRPFFNPRHLHGASKVQVPGASMGA